MNHLFSSATMTSTPLPTYDEAAPDIEQQAVELTETVGSKKPNSDAPLSQSVRKNTPNHIP